jgi:hypothetical protein
MEIVSDDECKGSSEKDLAVSIDVSLVHAQSLSIEQLQSVLLSRAVLEAQHMNDKVRRRIEKKRSLCRSLCLSPSLPSPSLSIAIAMVYLTFETVLLSLMSLSLSLSLSLSTLYRSLFQLSIPASPSLPSFPRSRASALSI